MEMSAQSLFSVACPARAACTCKPGHFSEYPLVPGRHLLASGSPEEYKKFWFLWEMASRICLRIQRSAWSDCVHTLLRQSTELGILHGFLREGRPRGLRSIPACRLQARSLVQQWMHAHASVYEEFGCVRSRCNPRSQRGFVVFWPLPSGQGREDPVHRYRVGGEWPPALGAPWTVAWHRHVARQRTKQNHHHATPHHTTPHHTTPHHTHHTTPHHTTPHNTTPHHTTPHHTTPHP